MVSCPANLGIIPPLVCTLFAGRYTTTTIVYYEIFEGDFHFFNNSAILSRIPVFDATLGFEGSGPYLFFPLKPNVDNCEANSTS